MDQLKPYKNWVVTYPHDKVPLNPYTMQKASTVDALTWSDYATAEACVRFNPHLILGFVFTNTPFSGIDLDTYKTTDKAIIAKHKGIYERVNSYSELSPNDGVHIIVEAQLSENKKLTKELIELLGTGRYMTITGKVINNSLILCRQMELNEIFYYILQQQTQINPMVTDDLPETQTDDEVILAAANAANGGLFRQLYEGHWLGIYPSQSEADQAFVDIVAFYTDSKLQVGRIFHQSELGKRKKASRKDYLYHAKYGIISRSFDRKKPNVTWSNLHQIVKNHVDEQALKAITAAPIVQASSMNGNSNGYHSKLNKLPEFIQEDVLKFSFDPPPGIVGDVAQFIYRNAVHPVKEIASAAAIAFMAGICGRAYNISNTGLNHYMCVLAPTGGGKEGAAAGIERLASKIREKAPAIDQFMGPAEIASPQALIKHLSNVSPCFLSHKGEMGFWLQKLTDKYARANETGMRQILLDLYMKSGQNDIFRGSIYSDKAKDVKPVHSPAFSLFGDATPHTFYKAVDEENVEEGFVSRFCVVECDFEEYPIYNEAHGTIEPDASLINTLCGVIRKVVSRQNGNVSDPIQQTPEAHHMQMQFLNECSQKMRENRDSPEAKIYSRAHLRVLRLAGLIAVGINPDIPIVTGDCVEWARKFIVSGIASVTWRFEKGEIGEKTGYLEQQKALREFLFKYWHNGWDESMASNWGVTQEMYNAKVITRRFLQNKLMCRAPFRNGRNPQWEFELSLKALQDMGVLVAINMAQVRESGKVGIAYYITDYEAIKEPANKYKKRQKS